ncbi:hypothetical protein AAII07_03175 [Microvirga sp. 0TCS3.31]
MPPLFAGAGGVRRVVGPRGPRQRALLAPVPGQLPVPYDTFLR